MRNLIFFKKWFVPQYDFWLKQHIWMGGWDDGSINLIRSIGTRPLFQQPRFWKWIFPFVMSQCYFRWLLLYQSYYVSRSDLFLIPRCKRVWCQFTRHISPWKPRVGLPGILGNVVLKCYANSELNTILKKVTIRLVGSMRVYTTIYIIMS